MVARSFFNRISRRTTAEPVTNESTNVMQTRLGKPIACQSRELGPGGDVREMATPVMAPWALSSRAELRPGPKPGFGQLQENDTEN